MKFLFILPIYFLIFFNSFSLNEDSSFKLKLKSIEEYPIIKTGQFYYDQYKNYESSLNNFVTNTTIPSTLRDNITFKFKLSSKPVITYSYKFSFSGFDKYFRYFSLENSLKLFSGLNFLSH